MSRARETTSSARSPPDLFGVAYRREPRPALSRGKRQRGRAGIAPLPGRPRGPLPRAGEGDGPTEILELELAEGAQLLERLDHAGGHALLAQVDPAARVDVFLVGLVGTFRVA